MCRYPFPCTLDLPHPTHPHLYLSLPCHRPCLQVPKPDVVLTSYEAFTADAAELKAITWEAVVLDERHPWQRAALAKAHTALCDLSARYRLLLSGAAGMRSVDVLLNHISYLHPQYQTLEDIPGGVEHMPEAQQIQHLRQLVEPYSLRRPRSLLGGEVLPAAEVRIPVSLTPAQAAAYRTVLTRSYELLSDPKPSRHSGYRAAQVRWGVVWHGGVPRSGKPGLSGCCSCCCCCPWVACPAWCHV